jgi:hypothetical protein
LRSSSITFIGIGDPCHRQSLDNAAAQDHPRCARDGITGLIETPSQTYAIGYANQVQLAGVADSRWMADLLSGNASSMKLRDMAKVSAAGTGARPVAIDLATLSRLNPGDEVVMQLAGLGAARALRGTACRRRARRPGSAT